MSMNFAKIQLLVYDCDGVLTDNRVYVSEKGEEMAAFHRGDGYGIQLLREMGIRQLILSTEKNPIVQFRAAKLHLEVLYQVIDKKSTLLSYCDVHGIALENVMMIGNDLNDREAMLAVGQRGCPIDAEPEIKGICEWVATLKGGYGVIRELARVIFAERR